VSHAQDSGGAGCQALTTFKKKKIRVRTKLGSYRTRAAAAARKLLVSPEAEVRSSAVEKSLETGKKSDSISIRHGVELM